MGLETEYNIYCSKNKPSTDDAINMMINVLKGVRLGRKDPAPRHFLANGGLIYSDVGAPEYSTPECVNPRDLVIFDKAGERIVRELARKVSVLTGCDISIYKKNSDGFGHSSGCHENYSVSPDLFLRLTKGELSDHVISLWTTFLAVRQIVTGNGKVGYEFDSMPCPFQMSQRADFIVTLRKNLTLYDRPVIQTRDESLADERLVKRLHVICGDANICEPSILMKGGLTSLMLMALEDGYLHDRSMPVLTEDIPYLFKLISRDIRLEKEYKIKLIKRGACQHEQSMPVLRIFITYLDALIDYFLEKAAERLQSQADRDSYKYALFYAQSTWQHMARKNYESLFGVCDWITKLVLAEKLLKKRSASLEDLASNLELDLELRSYLDMGYSNMDRDVSVYANIVKNGRAARVVSDEEIKRALTAPPLHGRANQRVRIMQKFPNNVRHVNWDKVTLVQDGEEFGIELNDPAGYNEQAFDGIIQASETPGDLSRAWKSLIKEV